MSKAMSKSDWKDGFLFVGNQLALDFLNTRPVQNGEPAELLPDFVALLRWFRAADLLNSRQVVSLQRQWGGSANAQRTMEAMRQLREKLKKEILEWERSGSVQHSTQDQLNKLMAEHSMRTRLRTNGKSYLTELWFEPREPEDLFAPLAHSAGCISMTPARKAHDAGAACNCVGIALRSQPTRLADVSAPTRPRRMIPVFDISRPDGQCKLPLYVIRCGVGRLLQINAHLVSA